MHTLGSAPRFGLRALFLASVVFVSGLSQVRADSITLDWDGVNPGSGVHYKIGSGSWVGTTAGQFTWHYLSGSTMFGTSSANGSIKTFCIELQAYLTNPHTFDITPDLHTLPDGIGGMGIPKAQQLFYLANNAQVGGAAVIAGATVQVLQGAIWNIINQNDGDFDTYAGDFKLNSNANTTSTTYGDAVNAVLANVSANWSTHVIGSGSQIILGLTTPNTTGNPHYGQDQMIFIRNENYQLVPVPVPAGVVLAGMGIACVGGLNFLRRRKAAVHA